MSEKVLEAIVKLLSIIARQGGTALVEKQVIKHYLEENLEPKHWNHYLSISEQYLQSKKDGKSEIVETCSSINKELGLSQKIVILVKLTELAYADKQFTEEEEEYLITVCSSFNVPYDWYFSIKMFIVATEAEELITANMLVVGDRPLGEESAAKFIHKPYMRSSFAVLRFSVVELYFLRFFPRKENISLNGFLLQPEKIYLLPNGSVLKGETTEPIFYSEITSKFAKIKGGVKITLKAENLNFTYGKGKNGIKEVNISEESGNMVAIMGASGSGKSTLLNVLNGNIKPDSGSVKINGMDLHKESHLLKGIIGYVPQDDLLIEDLTVKENLFYSAKLCHKNIGKEATEKLVKKTLDSLGLSEIAHLRVGSVLDKTISGGQRKRLNIGLELLREPSILFVDEPTSGLSSRDSENIIDLLRQLSRLGKIIFSVIHQPSSDIYKVFDRVIIMDQGGYQIYYGNPVEAVVYFKSKANMINASQGVCPECGNVNPEQIFNIIETKILDEFGNVTRKRRLSPLQWKEIYDKSSSGHVVNNAEEKPGNALETPNLLKQFFTFLQRDALSKLRNRQYMAINILQAPLLALVLAFIMRYYKIDESDNVADSYFYGHNVNIPGYIFISVIVALFIGLILSAEEIIKDAKIRTREKFLNLNRHSYLLSKLAIMFIFSAFQVFLYVLIGNAVLEIDAMNWRYWLVLFSTACFANMLGLNISATFKSAIAIYITVPILLIPQMILGGLVIDFDEINPFFNEPGKVPLISDIMTSRWAFEALTVTQFKDNPLERSLYPYDKKQENAEYYNSHYMPKLEAKYEYLHDNFNEERNKVQERRIRSAMRLLQTELRSLGNENPFLAFEQIDQLALENYDKKMDLLLYRHIRMLREFFNKGYLNATVERDKFVSESIDSPEDLRKYRYLLSAYDNKSVEELVKNINSHSLLVEYNGRLIRKISPIFFRPTPEHQFDYRAAFYSPEKHFGGYFIDTLYFNVIVIWLFSFLLYFTLYAESFKWLLSIFDNVKASFTFNRKS